MNPPSSSPESDPAIAAAFAVEQQHELENQRRTDMLQLMANNRVPSYEQLLAAQEWAAGIRENSQFDEDGNLVQEGGLTPVSESTLDAVEDYFDENNWLLSARERALCREITDNYTPNSIEKVKVLSNAAPELRTVLSSDLPQPMAEKLQKADQMTEDIYALVKLHDSIEKAQPDRANRKDKIAESGLYGINIDKAIQALEKAVANGTPVFEESESGLTWPQKNALLELFGYKPTPEKTAEDPRAIGDPTFLQLRRRTGLNNILRPDLTLTENARRFLHGTERKPEVQKRMQLENDIAIAQRRLDKDDSLSWFQRKELRARIEDTQKKIQKGSLINPDKYGSGASKAGVQERERIYNPQNLLKALHKLKESRSADGEGLLSKKIHNALTREISSNPNLDQEANFDIKFDNDESFMEVVNAMKQKFDSIALEREASLSDGEYLDDYDIDMIYIEAQLATAQEIANDYFDAHGLDKTTLQYNTYVRQLLQAVHAYEPFQS